MNEIFDRQILFKTNRYFKFRYWIVNYYFIFARGKYSIIYYPLYILLFIRYAEIGGKISIDRLKIIHDSSRMRTERERERHFLYRLPGNFIVSMIFNGCMVLDNCYSNRIRMGIRTMLGIWNFGCILFSRIKRAQQTVEAIGVTTKYYRKLLISLRYVQNCNSNSPSFIYFLSILFKTVGHLFAAYIRTSSYKYFVFHFHFPYHFLYLLRYSRVLDSSYV